MQKKRVIDSRGMEKSLINDYVEIAIDYAKSAIKDKKRKKVCVSIQHASQRFLDDLRRSKKKDCPFIFDEWHANDVCDFIEKLPHVEGKWSTLNIELHPSQVFFLVQLFGFRSRDAVQYDFGEYHPRRFTSALYATARKSGKSTLAAAILIYCLCCEPEAGAQVLTAATTYDQASIIFKIAKRMIEKSQDLREYFGVQAWAKAITREEVGASIKAIHAKASTQDGLNPSHTALDEIHAHKSADLLNVLTSAAGARANPLWLYTTTEGYINAGPWSDIKQFVKQLLSGVFGTTADHFLAVFFKLDEADKTLGIQADEEFDERNWIKANPLIEANPHLLTAIRKEAIEAKQMPSRMAEFRIKRLNLPASTAEGWVNLAKWNECSEPFDIHDLVDYPCYGGLDLASTSDLTSLRLVWIVEGILYTHAWRWCPSAAVRYRTERGTVPYAAWVESGLITETEGNSVDYSAIEADVKAVKEMFHVKQFAFDRWNATDLCNRLTEDEIPMIEFVQGPKSYHPAMQALEIAYMSGKFRHGGDPVLAWCASNLVARMDQNLNLAPDKKRSADKIDDMSALLMAVGIGTSGQFEDKKYQMLIL